jgi:hypothetical protein
LLILPSLSLPPHEFCFGTSPIQAEKSLPDRNAFGSAMLATRAVANAGPTPGMSSSRRLSLNQTTVLCPGVITHASNIVEHPAWIAERLSRFAKLVGRENVMAGADAAFDLLADTLGDCLRQGRIQLRFVVGLPSIFRF